ncbi:V-type ATP synthase subunit D [Confluentibacter citreus]|uniref:V-type ATP synthase subunit D n=1 Tax=Confluentibacter citreus TaxID=2007307 RepID=UPI000C28D27F|nr:V-type ATP synthase subunit D [Confluentibacter citreus]
MAEKILMNKNTLAALKLELKEYNVALPVFEMKEQQLKVLIQSITERISKLEASIESTNQDIKPWVGVFAEDVEDLNHAVKVKTLTTKSREVAGVPIEEFENIDFEDINIDTFNTPFWVDAAVELIKDQKTNLKILELEQHNMLLVQEELDEARRMKNALKEVFIPETEDNIRKIEIYLGDVERLAIGCAKLVKKKKQNKKAVL